MKSVIRITRAGWIYIGLTLLLGFAAVNTGNNLIYLIVSALLSFMGISGFFGRRNILRVELGLEPPSEIFANREFPLRLALRNGKGRFPAFLVRVRVEGRESLFPFVEKRSGEERSVPLIMPRRGRRLIGDVTVSSVFPFNFFVRSRSLHLSSEVLVFPEPVRCDLAAMAERERDWRGEKGADRAGYDADIFAIREYAHGDPLKYINWKATAKTGELKTKELSALFRQPVVIDMERVEIRDRELRVSCVTYAVLSLLRSGVPVGLSLEGRRYGPDLSDAHRLRLLRELALYGGE